MGKSLSAEIVRSHKLLNDPAVMDYIERVAQKLAKNSDAYLPNILRQFKDTWLMDINKYYFSEMVDAYLYLGPSDLLLAEPKPAEIFLNKQYMAELRRRAEIIDNASLTDQTDPDKVSDDQFGPFLYGAIRSGPLTPTVILEPPTKPAPSPD
jgi:hypothetical protein